MFDLAELVDHAVRERRGRVLPSGEVRFQCPHPDWHRNGDAHPSARWNSEKGTWYCDVCKKGGGCKSLAQALGINIPKVKARARRSHHELVATYQYVDERCHLLFEVCRYQPKDFSQRRPDGNGGWIYSLNGVRRVLYRLPEVIDAVAAGRPIHIVEGEKDADNLVGLGLMATCNPGGADNWRPECSEALRDADVVLLPDQDEPGFRHAEAVTQALAGMARSVRIVHVPDAKDVSDWLNGGHTKDELMTLLAQAPPVEGGNGHAPADAPSSDPDRTENLTELGNARRFVHQHGVDVRYVNKLGGWLVWDRRRWTVDETGVVVRLAKETVGTIWQEAESASSLEERKAIVRHALKSETDKGIKALLSLAWSEAGLPLAVGELDADPWLFNCLNGTVDLRTGELRAHRREDLLTKLAPVAFDPAATCPMWDEFLDRIMGGNQELIGFLQRAIGYALTGNVIEQVLFLLYGIGANGKSTLLETVRTMMGDYARQADFTSFLVHKQDGPRNDLARLMGARFVSAGEVEGGRRLAEAVVKQVTGGDTISSRFLYREFFEFQPTFKLFLACNHKPTIRGTDYAIWRRIRVIPFTVTIPPEEQDRQLPEKLRAELPGILAWAVRGCDAWWQHGLGQPKEVEAATATYRDEMHPLAPFLDECCIEALDRNATAKDLYEAYTAWCDTNGEKPEAQRVFGRRLTERGFGSRKSDGRIIRVGIGLLARAAGTKG